MGQTLTNGIYLPDEGEVRCYDGLASNWTTLDAVVGGYRAHVANENIHITSAERGKWNNGVTQAYVLRYASVSLTALGTVAFSALDNTDNVKIGDKVLDSEGKLFALTAVDTANSTATLSALLIDLSKDSDLSNYYTKPETDTLLSYKATDSNVVHKSGNETVGGVKTFSNDIIRGTASNNTTIQKRNIIGNYTASTTGSDSSSYQSITATLNYSDSTPSKSATVSLYVVENAYSDGRYSAFRSSSNNTTNLGTSEKKWANVYATNYYYGLNHIEFSTKFVTTDTNQTISGNKTFSKINGVEPSSLSLPSGNASNVIDISSYISALDGTSNSYTVPANGWISIAITGTAIAIVSSSWSDSRLRESSGNVRMLYPVLKNETLDISVTGTTLAYARFIPCQGNV